MKVKRILASVFAGVIAFGCCLGFAGCKEGPILTSGDFVYCYVNRAGSNYRLSKDRATGVTILSLAGDAQVKEIIVIPESIDGLPVIAIGMSGMAWGYGLVHDGARYSKLYLPKTLEIVKNRSDIVVMRVVSYIKFHFKKKLTLAEVADAVGLTPNYVGEIFAKRMGVSFNAYLMQTRLNYAKTLLMRGDCTVEDVAKFSGFGSQTYFSDCFKKQFGTTPTAVKKNASQGILFGESEAVGL